MAPSQQTSPITANDTDRVAPERGDDWIVRRANARERHWFLLHALSRGLFWFVPFGVVALLWLFWFEVPISDPYPLGILLAGALLLLFFLLWGALYPNKWMVAIGRSEVVVDRGILWVTRVFVSYDRVQQVDVVSTPMMSRLGLTELVLHTAAGGVHLYALAPEDAALIADRVRDDQPRIPLLRQ